MVTQEKPAVVHFVDDVLGAGVGVISTRDVIEHQQDAGHRLHDEDEQQTGTEDIGPSRAARHRFVEHLGLNLL
jgi:hypothetical protein